MMTPKERAVMQQAFDALENAYENGFLTGITGLKTIDTISALREALDHSGEANEMVGCAYCNNPLFAGTKCNNCGFITLAEQAEQEPVGRWNWNEAKFEWLTKFDYHKHHMTPLYATPVQQEEQEPVGTVGQLFDDHVIAKSGLDKNRMVYLAPARAVIAADSEKNK